VSHHNTRGHMQFPCMHSAIDLRIIDHQSDVTRPR